jgi:hypothetical protein
MAPTFSLPTSDRNSRRRGGTILTRSVLAETSVQGHGVLEEQGSLDNTGPEFFAGGDDVDDESASFSGLPTLLSPEEVQRIEDDDLSFGTVDTLLKSDDDEELSVFHFKGDFLEENHTAEVVPVASPINPQASLKEQEADQFAEDWNATWVATLDLLSMCGEAGVSLAFTDKLITFLRTCGKDVEDPTSRVDSLPTRSGGGKKVEFGKLPSRMRVLQLLNKRFRCPLPVEVKVGSLYVPTFDFLEQVMDLFNSDLTDDLANLCVNFPVGIDSTPIFEQFIPDDDDKYVEILGSNWYARTCQHHMAESRMGGYKDENGIPVHPFLVPLIFYMDKTGTDVYQRYSLEPLMFTLALFRSNIREMDQAWRHLGFIPEPSSSQEEQGDYLTTEDGVRLYHECLTAMLSQIAALQRKPPIETLDIGGHRKRCMLLFEVSIVAGDQLSQDKNCLRKPVTAGAGRLHRACMNSFHQAASPGGCGEGGCRPVKKALLDRLQKIAGGLDRDVHNLALHYLDGHQKDEEEAVRKLLERRAKIAGSVLENVLSTYKTVNAWSELTFGANEDGIHRATVDDFMHYFESGVGMYVGKVAFLGMTKSERKKIEVLTSKLFQDLRSGVLINYPCGRFHSGFSNMTLLTASEKIGILFSLHLVLRTEEGKEIFEKAMNRQQLKYISFPIIVEKSSKRKRGDDKKKPTAPPCLEDYPLRTEQHFHRDKNKPHPFPRTKKSAKQVIAHIKGHSLHFLLALDLDVMQLDRFLSDIWAITRTVGQNDLPLPFLEDKGLLERDAGKTPIMEQYIFSRLLPPAPASKQTAITGLEDAMGNQLFIDDVLQDSEALSEQRQLSRGKSKKLSAEERKAQQEEDKLAQQTKHTFTTLQHHDGWIDKHRRIKPVTKGDGNTSCILCPFDQFQEFLEVLLCFHAYLHGSNSVPLEDRSDFATIQSCFDNFVDLYRRTIYRGDNSLDDGTCKVHAHYHPPRTSREYCDPKGAEAGKGERGLKKWAKLPAKTAIKRGKRTFANHTALRVQQRQLLLRSAVARRRLEARRLKDNDSSGEEQQRQRRSFRKKPHYVYRLSSDRKKGLLVRLDKDGFEEPVPLDAQSPVPLEVLTAMERFESKQYVFRMWCETEKLDSKDTGSFIRCCPYMPDGLPYYDWAAVEFAEENNNVVPAKVLLFYEDLNGERQTIVHSTTYRRGQMEERGNFGIGGIVSRWELMWTQAGWPKLSKVPVSAIQYLLLVIEETKNPVGRPIPPRCKGKPGRKQQKKYLVQVVEPQTDWAAKFVAWGKQVEIDNRPISLL